MSNTTLLSTVLAVSIKDQPGIPKHEVKNIQLLEGFGVEGDYHAGKYVRHRYLVKKDPTRPNHRQILLIDNHILSDLKDKGIELEPGSMGENIIVGGLDMMSLPIGTRLEIGECLLELSEVRDPCAQLNDSHPDLFRAVINEQDGETIYNAGIFARILKGGTVNPGDQVRIIV